MHKSHQIVAIIPARDEALSIACVINDIQALRNIDGSAIFDRIIVCDNASTDQTNLVAQKNGAAVVYQPQAGYGIACQTALGLIDHTDIVVFIDADASLQIDESIDLLNAIHAGADLVVGARVDSWQQAHSMSIPQRFGNTLASYLIRIIWQVPVSDLGPFRAIRFDALTSLGMQDQHYGWTVEMQVKAIQQGLKLTEVPVHYRRRIGRSKISGTVRGVLGAAYGICSAIFNLALRPSGLKKQTTKS